MEETLQAVERSVQLLRATQDHSDVVEEARAFIQDEGGRRALLHAVAATNGLQDERIRGFISALGIDPAALALYLSNYGAAEAGIVDVGVVRRQMQTVNAQTTKALTFDLAQECPEGWAKLATALMSRFPAKLDTLMNIAGTFRLEPFRVVAALVLRIGVDPTQNGRGLLETLREIGWSPELVAASTGTLLNSHRPEVWVPACRAAAAIVGVGIVPFNLMWSHVDPGSDTLDRVTDEWKRSQLNEIAQVGASALAMAAPLLDEDDEDAAIEEDEDETYHTNDEFTSETGDLPSFAPKLKEGDAMVEVAYAFLEEVAAINCQLVVPVVLRNPWYITMRRRLHDTVCTAVANTLKSFTWDSELVDEPIPDGWDCTRLEQHIGSFAQLLAFIDVWSRILIPASSILIKAYADLMGGRGDRTRLSQKAEVRHRLRFEAVINAVPETSRPRFHILKGMSLDEEMEALSEWYWGLSKSGHSNMGFKAQVSVANAEREARALLKRMTDDNADHTFEQLVRVMDRDSMAAMSVFVNQIESYDKLGPLLVKHWLALPRTGRSAFVLLVASELATPRRPGRSSDALFVSKWLQLLARCIGQTTAAAEPRSSPIKLLPILRVVRAQFYAGDYSRGVPVLRELLTWGCNGVALAHVSVAQLERIMVGGHLGAAERLALAKLRGSNGRTASRNSLIEELTHSDLLVEFGILLARGLQYSNYEGGAKAVSAQLDELRETLQMFIQCLLAKDISKQKSRSSTPPLPPPPPPPVSDSPQDAPEVGSASTGASGATAEEAQTNEVPEEAGDVISAPSSLVPIVDLVRDYGVPVAAAFAMWRPYLGGIESLKELKVGISELGISGLKNPLYNVFWSLEGSDVSFKEAVYPSNTDRLATQLQAHKLRYNLVKQRIVNVAGDWFVDPTSLLQFVAHCLLPRATWSAEDALYTSRFVQLLATQQVPEFKLDTLLDAVLSRSTLVAVIRSCTVNEIESFGVLLMDLLGSEHVVKLLHISQWHEALVRSLQQTLDDPEVALNGMQLLTRLLPVFPALRTHAAAVQSVLELHKEEDSRPDLQTAATSLVSQIKLKARVFVESASEISALPEPKWSNIDVSLLDTISATSSTSNDTTNSGNGSKRRTDDSSDDHRRRQSRKRRRRD